MNYLLCFHHLSNPLKKFLLSCLLLVISQACAQWPKYHWVNNPVCTETSRQITPDITYDGNGGSIVVWADIRGKSYDIYAQRYDALGDEQWTAGGVLICGSADDQVLPQVVSDGNGGAYICWTHYVSGAKAIHAQLVNSSGTIQWATDGVEICSPGADKLNVRMVYDSNGSAIIVWEDYRNSEGDIYAQRVGSSGTMAWTSDGVAVCIATRHQRTPRITMDAGNLNAIITWDDGRNSKKADVYDIYAQKIDLSGSMQWATDGVAVNTEVNDQLAPDIVSDDSGGAVICWYDTRGANWDIYAQRIDASGAMVWTSTGVGICTSSGNQHSCRITTDGAFGAIVTWIDGRNSGANHVYVQRVDYAGNAQWTTNGAVVCGSSGLREMPVIISDDAGGAIMSWSDMRNGSHYDIYAQSVNSSGVMQWTTNGTLIASASGDQLNNVMTKDEFGGAFIAWDDARSGSSEDIYAQNVLKDGGLGVVPEILVKGNHINILDNDNSPAANDHSDFGSTLVITSVVKTFKVFNNGNTDLEITNIYTTGAQRTEFVPQTITYPVTIAAHDSFGFQVTFTPVSVGVSNATLNIDNSDSNEATYNFAIRGTLKAAEIDIKGNNTSIADGDATPDLSDSTDFGKTRVNKALTRIFTIVNAGTDTLKINNISISGTHASEFTFPTITYPRKLGPNKTMTVPVTFLPAASGLRIAQMNVSSNDPNEATYDFSIQGTAVIPAILVKGNHVLIADNDLIPSSADLTDFGQLNISKQKTSGFKIFNTGTEDLTINGISIAGLNNNDFTIPAATYPKTVSPGDSLSVDVTFMPLALGARVAEMRIDNDDDGKPLYNFNIRGTAIAQEISVKGNGALINSGDNTPGSADNTFYGNVMKNGSKTNRFFIVNTGTDELTVNNIALSGANAGSFSLGALTPASPIAAGDSSFVDIAFNPAVNGLHLATVTIASNDADEGMFTFDVLGTGTSPVLEVKGNNRVISNGSLGFSLANHTDFGSVEIPNSQLRTFKMFNTGNTNLHVSTIVVSGSQATEFTLQGITFPQDIAAGDSLSVNISFMPADTGLRRTSVHILSNDPSLTSFDFVIGGHATRKVNIDENQLNNGISVYPNPATSEVLVSLEKGEGLVSLLALDGKEVYTGTVQAGVHIVDVSGISAGIYIVKVKTGGAVALRRLVIRR